MTVNDLCQMSSWVLCAPLHMAEQVAHMPLLGAEERSRALRFRKVSDQRRYQLAHHLKRYCLSQVLGLQSAELSLGEGEKGKPYCRNSGAPFFNLSHSGDWVLLGMSKFGEIGVDVEVVHRDVSESVMSYGLNSEQMASLGESGDATNRFMLYWTQKEAVIKALGLGLSMDLHSIHCSGELGKSQVWCEGQILNLGSLRLAEDYWMSVATSHSLPSTYKIQSWDLAVEPLNNL